MIERVQLCGEKFDKTCPICKTCHTRQICERRTSTSVISELIDNFVSPKCVCGKEKFCPIHQSIGIPKDF